MLCDRALGSRRGPVFLPVLVALVLPALDVGSTAVLESPLFERERECPPWRILPDRRASPITRVIPSSSELSVSGAVLETTRTGENMPAAWNVFFRFRSLRSLSSLRNPGAMSSHGGWYVAVALATPARYDC